MSAPATSERVSYEEFRDEWLADVDDPRLSTLEKGRRFGVKLTTEWMDVTADDDDFVICDGSGDGGVDIAYLRRADTDAVSGDDNSVEGDTWYLVQSKYGAAYAGVDTILKEGNKLIKTLQGQNQRLAQDAQRLMQKIDSFLQKRSEADRIVMVFATVNPISKQEREVLNDLKLIGRKHVDRIFDVEEVSLQTIWENLGDVEQSQLFTELRGKFVKQTPDLLVGTVSLMDLFDFLESYKGQTGDLNQLYGKNVRQFLGGRRKVNKGIARTLEETPEKFGLYNNGITIVVSNYTLEDDKVVTAVDPYVVNGCQTTKTIWQVMDAKINSGGTGSDPAIDEWKNGAKHGGVVTKIVRSDVAEITNITRFTNSQNSVREQDFIALDTGYQGWANAMAKEYGIFLEIQRGSIAARKAWEKEHPDEEKYTDYVNAFELIKVYGAGWMSEPGLAFGKNAPFLPNGSVYSRIISRSESDPPFGARDLYATYKIKGLADKIGFGRHADLPSRRQSKFLFYYIVLKMLRNVILLTPQLNRPAVSENDLTEAVIGLADRDDDIPLQQLSKGAEALIDQYLTPSSQESAFNEDSFIKIHNGDLNAFLKAENLGKKDHSPKLGQALAIANMAFGMSDRKDHVVKALVEAYA